ncbi:MAG: SRPBCC family protein [Myxococcales bacterium]
MLKTVLILVALVFGGLLVFASTRPDKYHVERATTIAAPPEVIYAQLVDFKNWPAWSPWEKRDPQMKKSFEGPPSGAGSSYSWQGNKEVGKGKMTIVTSEPPQHITYRLEFVEPFKSVADTGFTLLREGDSKTAVTWAMDGTNNFISKLFSVVMDMDKMIGGDFAAGLASLKSVSESEAAKRAQQLAQAAAAASVAAAQQASINAASAAAEAAKMGKTAKEAAHGSAKGTAPDKHNAGAR